MSLTCNCSNMHEISQARGWRWCKFTNSLLSKFKKHLHAKFRLKFQIANACCSYKYEINIHCLLNVWKVRACEISCILLQLQVKDIDFLGDSVNLQYMSNDRSLFNFHLCLKYQSIVSYKRPKKAYFDSAVVT
jgi:hypothetical protein